MRQFILAFLLLLACCTDRVVYVDGPWPTLPIAKRPLSQLPTVFDTVDADGNPDLEKIKEKIHPADLMMVINAIYELQCYAEQMEHTINSYNTRAADHNIKAYEAMMAMSGKLPVNAEDTDTASTPLLNETTEEPKND